MRKLVLYIAIAFFLFTSSASGQILGDQARSGSVYSNIGVGMPLDLTSSSAEGMGIPGVSFYDSYVPGLANPAHWGHTVVSLASGGVSMKNISASDILGSSRNTLVSVNHFQLLLPLKSNRFGVSLSLAPKTRSNFRVLSTNTKIIGSGAQQDTLRAETENRGDGGVNSLELGFGWRINDNISVGYAGSLVFASIQNNVVTLFEDDNFRDTEFSLNTDGIGFGNRIGLYLSYPGIFRENDRINIGTAFSLPVHLESERIQESDRRIGNRTETIVLKEGPGLGKGDIQLPMRLSGGVSYQPSAALTVMTEGLYERWSDFEFDFEPAEEQMVTDRVKVGAGLRYFPFLTDSDNFLSNFKYRLGVSYDTGHLNINNRKIETILFSAGFGIVSPRRNSNSSIDISFQYGIRGTQRQNLVKENIWSVQLSLNLAELMFFRPKLQ